MYNSVFKSWASKTDSASLNQENPSPFPVSWISLVFQYFYFLLSPFSLSWHLALLSSTSYIITAFMLAFSHPGLEIKLLYSIHEVAKSVTWLSDWTELNEYSKIHKIIPTCRGCLHVTVYTRQVNWLTWLNMWTHTCIFECLQLEGSYVGNLLYLKINPLWIYFGS